MNKNKKQIYLSLRLGELEEAQLQRLMKFYDREQRSDMVSFLIRKDHRKLSDEKMLTHKG